jgi:hypothetical protein
MEAGQEREEPVGEGRTCSLWYLSLALRVSDGMEPQETVEATADRQFLSLHPSLSLTHSIPLSLPPTGYLSLA